ncbi:MAG: MgtC/SapB family protein [Saprospiraceae bacterium]|nr:MgtC/SapB family protein [Saprospiraceae bacterium]
MKEIYISDQPVYSQYFLSPERKRKILQDIIFIDTETLHLEQGAFFIRLLVAVGIGFVVGLEREHASIAKKEEIFAGLRTFVLVSLLGFVTSLLSAYYSYWILIAGFLAISLTVTVSYWISARRGQLGGTTEMAILLVYLLGALTLLGQIGITLTITVIMVIFLSLKLKFRTIVGNITQPELYAFIQFVVVTLLIFPFLPNESFGPYDVINPREIGWVIVLTSGAGFIGYMLIKFLGANRGILLTGILGGLVSSTVVTWVFSKRSKTAPELSDSCSVAIMSASTIMILRVVVWILIFNKALLTELIFPLLLILSTALGTVLFFHRREISGDESHSRIPLGEPLNLREALFFGIIYVAILLIVSYANDQFGNRGIFLSSAIAGLTDIDAITISLSKIAGSAKGNTAVQIAIIVATLSNTLIKLGISIWAGSNPLKKNMLKGYGLIFIAGILGILLLVI